MSDYLAHPIKWTAVREKQSRQKGEADKQLTKKANTSASEPICQTVEYDI